MTCDACGDAARHFVARAYATKRWRGKSFDADQAMGNLGLSLMRALEMPPTAFQRFSETVRITPYRETTELNPTEAMPEGGEWWDFHVAVKDPVDDATLDRMKKAAEEALSEAQNFEEPHIAS